MADLGFLLTFPRVLRHASRVGTHLVPDHAVVLDGHDAAVRGALAAAGSGDFAVARSLLAATRLGEQWERRDACVAALTRYALHRPGWLDAWLEAEPGDPDAWVLKADLAISRAWEIRSAQRAEHVTSEQFAAFHVLLQDAVPVLEQAVELNPQDPVPWRIALNHAMGSQAPRKVFDGYLMEVLDRDPSHYGCHAAALQYVCAKWFGSHEEMFEFAEAAADRAEPGALLNALPIQAVTEYAADRTVAGRGPVPRERVEAAVERTLAFSRNRPAGDAAAAEVRNHLASALVDAERWDEALETFAVIGVHARRYPWALMSENPREGFLRTRKGVRARLARRIPFFSGGPAAEAAPAPDTSWCPKAVALCAAPLRKVEESALLTGTTLRMAPLPRPATGTFVEIAWAANGTRRGGLRGALLGDASLAETASTMTSGENWPALILHQAEDGCGITLMRRGKQSAAIGWGLAEPVPDLAAASAAARELADAYGIDDPRPLTALLRADGAGPDRLRSVCEALGLPRLPETFGESPEVLGTLPGAKLVQRRSFLTAVKQSLAADED